MYKVRTLYKGKNVIKDMKIVGNVATFFYWTVAQLFEDELTEY